MFRFIGIILELISNPKGFVLKLLIGIFFAVFFCALRSLDYTVIYICLGILSLAVLYGLIYTVVNSKNNTERWLKVIRIIALVMLVFLLENQTALYIYLGMLLILFIYTLWIVVSGKIKDTKDNLKDTSLKEKIGKSIADVMKGPDRGPDIGLGL